MDVWTLKLISIPIIFVVNFITGFLPYYFICRKIRLTRRKSDQTSSPYQTFHISLAMKRFLSLANFFCGGVFLSTCLIGLYPGVTTKFANVLKKNPAISHYPYAGLSLALGFFSVWLLEILVHACIHPRSHASQNHKSQSANAAPKVNHSMNEMSLVSLTPPNYPHISTDDELINREEELVKTTHDSGGHEVHSHVPISGSILASIMLTFALGSHSIIEGLGFGVLDELNITINMLITMLIHESICAVSLGVNIASKNTSFKIAVFLLLIFSMLIPMGIGLGLVLDLGLHKDITGQITVAVLQGIAAGTFIYVVFMEILLNEMSHKDDALLRLFMMVLGFVVIASMKLMHSHSDRQRFNNQTFNFSSASPLET